MEEFLPLLFIILFWSLIGTSAKRMRQNGKSRKQTVRQKKADGTDTDKPAANANTAAPVVSPRAVSSPVSHGHSDSYRGSLGVSFMEGVDPCHDDPYLMPKGSLHTDMPEGTDPCHPDSASAASRVAAAEPAPSGLRLHVTGNEVVQGFIWGEILNRKRA